MEKFCPPGRLQRHILELNLLLVLYTVRNKELFFSRKVGSQLNPPGELVGEHWQLPSRMASVSRRNWLVRKGQRQFTCRAEQADGSSPQVTTCVVQEVRRGCGALGVLTATPRWPGIPGTPRSPTSPRGPGGPG